MLRNLVLLSTLLSFFSFSSIAQETIKLDIFFDSGVSSISDINRQELNDLYINLSSYSDYYVSVVGHTDQVGSYEYNDKLAKERAKSVEEELISIGVSSLQLSAAWRGESQLRVIDNSDESKQQNRRVEIIATCFKIESVDQITDFLLPDQKQYYNLDNQKSDKLTLEQGTIVEIPDNAFVYADSGEEAAGQVVITAQEVFGYNEIIQSDWHTMSGNEILETAGMVQVTATADGRELLLKEGKSIQISIPTETNQEGMQLFDGQVEGDSSNWVASETPLKVSAEEMNPVKIDLTAIFDYDLGEFKKPSAPRYNKMPSYPSKRLQPNPPSETLYTGEKYDELMKSYESKLKEYKEFEASRSDLLSDWNKEVDLRLKSIYDYRKELRDIQTKIRIKSAIAKVYKQRDEVSHDDLMSELIATSTSSISISGFNKRNLILKALQGSAKRVIEERELSMKVDTTTNSLMKQHEIWAVAKKLKNEASLKRSMENGVDDRATKLRYVFSSSNLGWFNCDRFLQIAQADKRNLEVQRSKDEVVFVIFKDFRGVLKSRKLKNGKALFNNIPKESKVSVIGIKLSEDAKPMMAVKEMVIENDTEVALDYNQSSLAQIKNALIVGDPFTSG